MSFGQNPNQNIFGSSSQPTTTASTTTTASAPSLFGNFGASSGIQSTGFGSGSAFGTTSTNPAPSTGLQFGASNTTNTNTTGASGLSFGASAVTSAPTLGTFGAASTTFGTGTGALGSSTQSKPGGFGFSLTSSTNAPTTGLTTGFSGLGSSTTQGLGGTIFGSSTQSKLASSGLLSATSTTIPATTSSSFGIPASTGFGTTTSTNQSSSIFGSSTIAGFGSTSTGGSFLGTSTIQSQPKLALGAPSGFGVNTSTSVTTAATTSGVSESIFGQNTTASTSTTSTNLFGSVTSSVVTTSAPSTSTNFGLGGIKPAGQTFNLTSAPTTTPFTGTSANLNQAQSSTNKDVQIKAISEPEIPKINTNKTLMETVETWEEDLKALKHSFNVKVQQIKTADSLIANNGAEISNVIDKINTVEASFATTESVIDFIENSQKEIEQYLDLFESQLSKIANETNDNPNLGFSHDKQRCEIFDMAQKLNARLDNISDSLVGTTEKANELSYSLHDSYGSSSQFSSIMKILSSHSNLLATIDQESLALEKKVELLAKSHDKATERTKDISRFI